MARSLPPAAAASVAAHKVGRPVFYQLNRNEDFQMNGGEFAFATRFARLVPLKLPSGSDLCTKSAETKWSSVIVAL